MLGHTWPSMTSKLKETILLEAGRPLIEWFSSACWGMLPACPHATWLPPTFGCGRGHSRMLAGEQACPANGRTFSRAHLAPAYRGRVHARRSGRKRAPLRGARLRSGTMRVCPRAYACVCPRAREGVLAAARAPSPPKVGDGALAEARAPSLARSFNLKLAGPQPHGPAQLTPSSPGGGRASSTGWLGACRGSHPTASAGWPAPIVASLRTGNFYRP